MTRGVLLYCFDTPETAYSRIADRCIALVKKHLGLPVTVVTDRDTRNNIRSHCDFKTIEIEKNNTKQQNPGTILNDILPMNILPTIKPL